MGEAVLAIEVALTDEDLGWVKLKNEVDLRLASNLSLVDWVF